MNFNSDFLNYKPVFTQEETKKLDEINETLSLKAFLENKNLRQIKRVFYQEL